MQLEYTYDLPLYSIELIHKNGTSEFSSPSRMTLEIAHQFAKGTLDEEESLVDYRIVEVSDDEASF